VAGVAVDTDIAVVTGTEVAMAVADMATMAAMVAAGMVTTADITAAGRIRVVDIAVAADTTAAAADSIVEEAADSTAVAAAGSTAAEAADSTVVAAVVGSTAAAVEDMAADIDSPQIDSPLVLSINRRLSALCWQPLHFAESFCCDHRFSSRCVRAACAGFARGLAWPMQNRIISG
jgi:hypothetical protein